MRFLYKTISLTIYIVVFEFRMNLVFILNVFGFKFLEIYYSIEINKIYLFTIWEDSCIRPCLVQ